MKHPNFIIGGSGAAGTSYLSAVLAFHPDIYLPKIQRPEPNFFHYSWKYNEGIDWYLQTWFHEVENEIAIGERSSHYLASEVAPSRIKQFFPHIKLIFCLRNPLERAWGNYRFTALEGHEPLSFIDALEQEEERMKKAQGKWAEIQPHNYIERGKYYKYLVEYIRIFGRENIFMIKTEEMSKNPQETIQKVCAFLGVDTYVTLPQPPVYTSPSVVDLSVQVALLDYFGERFSEFVECIRKEEDISNLITKPEDAEKISILRANMLDKKNPMS